MFITQLCLFKEKNLQISSFSDKISQSGKKFWTKSFGGKM